MLSSLFYSFYCEIIKDVNRNFAEAILFFVVLLLPCLLGGLFSALRSKTRFKKTWFVFWIILTILLAGFEVFLCYVLFKKEVSTFQLTGTIFSCVAFLLTYLGGCVLGHFFNVRKVHHWLAIFPTLALFVFCFYAIVWFSMSYNYGSITDEQISEQKIENAQGVDYEIEASTSDAWGNDYRVLIIRGVGDSVYVQTTYGKCAKVSYEMDSTTKQAFVRIGSVSGDTSQWIPLGVEERNIVAKFKTAIEEYEREYSTGMVLDGYYSSFSLTDFKRGTYRRLGFDNAKYSGVYYAYSLEKMMEKLMSQRDEFVNMLSENAARQCAEEQNKIVDQIRKEQENAQEVSHD